MVAVVLLVHPNRLTRSITACSPARLEVHFHSSTSTALWRCIVVEATAVASHRAVSAVSEAVRQGSLAATGDKLASGAGSGIENISQRVPFHIGIMTTHRSSSSLSPLAGRRLSIRSRIWASCRRPLLSEKLFRDWDFACC